jgi:hypothetical protein
VQYHERDGAAVSNVSAICMKVRGKGLGRSFTCRRLNIIDISDWFLA